jgi:hypothetical protein
MPTGANSITTTSMSTCLDKLIAVTWIAQVDGLTMIDWTSTTIPLENLKLSRS